MGRANVDVMLDEMGPRHLAEWIAFSRLEPFGQRENALLAGVIASTIANVNRDSDKKRDAFTPSDFMIDYDGSLNQEEELSLEESVDYLRQWAALANQE